MDILTKIIVVTMLSTVILLIIALLKSFHEQED